MNALSDIDYTLNVSGTGINTIAAQDEAGNSLGSVRVYSGQTASNFADPEIFTMIWSGRGLTHHIDTSRYRILSLKWGLLRPRDVNLGSIGRVIWHIVGDTLSGQPAENVSATIILRHLA